MIQTAFEVCTSMNNSISMYFDLEKSNFLCILLKIER